jgi:hypothetical protein
MVEIALSIAVVAFALVAILGVLPTGMTVQKDNRDDNVINQEGRYWLEAIRSGSRGIEDLTNYVESITITNNRKSITIDSAGRGVLNLNGTTLRPVDIISLLSTPKYTASGNNVLTNAVIAHVKAITGPASEKGPLTNEFSFRYEMQVEVTPSGTLTSTAEFPDQKFASRYAGTLANSLYEIRLIFRWPLVQRGNGWFVGNNRKTFRGRVAGGLTTETNVTTAVRTAMSTTFGLQPATFAPNFFAVTTNLTFNAP